MSFSAFKKKPQKSKTTTPKPLVSNPVDELFQQHPGTFKERLLFNGGEGLSNILIWVNIFASAWLVSGIVLQNISLFSQIFVPLMSLFLLAKNREQISTSLRGRVFLISAPIMIALSIIYVAYFNYQYSRPDLSIMLLMAIMTLHIQNHFATVEARSSVSKIIIYGSTNFILAALLGLLGLFSQQEAISGPSDLVFVVLGIMPGFVLTARQFLIDSPYLSGKGWVFEKTISKDNKERLRPGGLSRIVIGSMVLGAAIPSLLLPLGILPKSLFIVTLSFYFVPSLAQTLQKESGPLDERVLKVTLFATLVTLLTYVGAYVSRFGWF